MAVDLRKKYGPLPLWAWVLVGAGAAAYLYFRSQSASAPADPKQASGGGGGRGGGSTTRITQRITKVIRPKRQHASGGGPHHCAKGYHWNGRKCVRTKPQRPGRPENPSHPSHRKDGAQVSTTRHDPGSLKQGPATNEQGTNALAPGPAMGNQQPDLVVGVPVVQPQAGPGAPASGGPYGDTHTAGDVFRYSQMNGTEATGNGGGVATGSDMDDSSGDDGATLTDPSGRQQHVPVKFGHWVNDGSGGWTWDTHPAGASAAAGGGVGINDYMTRDVGSTEDQMPDQYGPHPAEDSTEPGQDGGGMRRAHGRPAHERLPGAAEPGRR